ncbi:MAG: ATP-binding cassette domain-containing protein, partial [Rhodobacteraceae bacterium]|nr:ATP-binding cassette domain-containing protein [Paracoccaceae bacterium]
MTHPETPSSLPLLQVENLTTAFGAKLAYVDAVRDVSFSVGGGRVLGIVGESGSGKSVCARSILRLLRAPGWVRQGRVLLEGRNLLDLPEAEMREIRGKDIAMVFQDPQSALNPVMRVGDQIVEALLVHGVPRYVARARALELLGQVGIPDVERTIDNYPHEFSGGMRQRVVIAIALANKPKLLIADEPTTALDVTIQAQILRLLVELRDQLGIAIIMITHDIGVVAELCDDVVVMYGGRLVESGPVGQVLTAPLHPYTVALLRAVPKLSGDDARLPAIPGQPPLPARLPNGCAFHPRCSVAQPVCQTRLPQMVQLEPGHSAACFVSQSGERALAPATVARDGDAPHTEQTSQPYLSVRNLRTDVAAASGGLLGRHTPVFAVDDISFDVSAGRTFGLVGESGCG